MVIEPWVGALPATKSGCDGRIALRVIDDDGSVYYATKGDKETSPRIESCISLGVEVSHRMDSIELVERAKRRAPKMIALEVNRAAAERLGLDEEAANLQAQIDAIKQEP